jgi:hypothetical protein
MANNKNPNEKQPGENPEGKYHFNPGNMAGKTPGDAERTAENRGEPHERKDKPALKPNDFPIETDEKKLKTQTGETVGSAASKELAENVADRLNEQAHREEEDRWA